MGRQSPRDARQRVGGREQDEEIHQGIAAVLGARKPNAFGTTLGAILIGILLTGTTMMDFQYYRQDVIKDFVLVVALIFSFTLSRKKQGFVAAVPL